MARDIFQLNIHYAIGPQPGMNVFHFAGDPTPTDNPDVAAQALIAGWIATMNTNWLALLSEHVLVIGYKCKRVNNGGGPGITEPVTATAGTRPGEFSAGAIGPCLIWSYQKLAGGWAAGRTFVPGVPDTDLDLNVFSDSLLVACETFFDLMLNVPTITVPPAFNYEFGIYSPTHNSFSGAEAAGVSGKPGVMNKRMKPAF